MMIKEVKSLSKRTIIMMIGTVLINIVSFITAPIFTRIMSTADFGIFSVFSSWINIFSIIFGGQTYGTLNNAKIEYSKEKYPNYCFNAFLISTIQCIGAGIILLIMSDILVIFLKLPKECLLWLVLGAYGTYMVTFFSSYLVIEKKVVQNLIITLIIVILTTGLSILLIIFSPIEGYLGRILGYSCVYFVASVFIAIYLLKFSGLHVNIVYWKFCLTLSGPLVMHGLSGILLSQSDRIMLMAQRGESTAGIYSFCYTIALPISVVSGAVNSAWTPEYYELMKKSSAGEIEKHYARQLFLITAIVCGYIMVAPEVIKVLAVKEYWEGIFIIPLVVVGYYYNFLYFFPANYEFYHKKTKFIAGSTMIAAFINILLNYALIPQYGMLGAAVATIVAYIFLFLVHDFIARMVIKGYSVKWKFYLRGITPVLVSFIIYEVFASNMLVRWLIGGSVAVLIVLKIKKQKAIL